MYAAGDPIGALPSSTPSSYPAPEAQTKPPGCPFHRSEGAGTRLGHRAARATMELHRHLESVLLPVPRGRVELGSCWPLGSRPPTGASGSVRP